MKRLTITLIIAVNLVLSATLYEHFSLFGVKPDIMLIIITSIAILYNRNTAMLIGLETGMIQDIIFSKPIGITALSYVIVAYVVGLYNSKIFKDNIIVPIFFTVMASIIKHTVLILMFYIIHLDFYFWSYIKSIALYELIYNSILSVLVYKGLQVIMKKTFANKVFKTRVG